MDSSFFQKPFDEETLLKLRLYRNYVDEWLPVFLTGKYSRPVHIFDFFCGPGKDIKGQPGSPVIAVQRIRKFCKERSDVIQTTPSVTFHFSDIESDYIAELKETLKEEECSNHCCKIYTEAGPFESMLEKSMPVLSDPSCACLVWMDQCGIKEVTPEVVNKLAECPRTDILFFISSSYINRFPEEDSVRKYYDLSIDELKSSEYRLIHRYICGYFRNQLPNGLAYHLAPFSIKKSSNIYGLIFGSSSYRGLDKFLRVCWCMDRRTGEANYPVEEEPSWWAASGEDSLFAEMNILRKYDIFKNDLADFIEYRTQSSELKRTTNHDIYEFTLENGFLPKHASEVLKTLKKNGLVDIRDLNNGKQARGYYIRWEEYQKRPRIVIEWMTSK